MAGMTDDTRSPLYRRLKPLPGRASRAPVWAVLVVVAVTVAVAIGWTLD